MADSQHGVPRSPRTTRSMPSSPNAHRSTERPVYIYKLPYCSYYQLCRHLDADKQWDVLAGLMRMDPVDIKLFANATLRGGSPADEVLKKFGERNGRISQVFRYLYEMQYFKGMQIIQKYVDPKYWYLLNDQKTEAADSSAMLFRCMETPLAPPYELEQVSMKSNLHPDSRNVNNPRTEGLLKGHKSTKLPSPTGQANGTKSVCHGAFAMANLPGAAAAGAAAVAGGAVGMSEEDRLREELASSGIKILSLKSRSPCSNLRVVKLNNVNVNDRINFKDIDLEPIKRIPYDELALATQNFADCNVLGKGGFGTVYRGSWKDVVVAVKKLQLYTRRQVSTASAHPGVPAKLVEKEEKRRAEEAHLRIKSMLTELRVLAMCRFPNILALYGVSVDNMSTPCIVYEFMPGGSLDDRLKRKQNYTSMPPLTWRQRASIARGTARGLNYLHTVKENHPLVHGDVKPANILLDGNLLPKLGDFGLTREGPEGECTHRDVSRLQGTKLYLPHEYLQSRHLSTKVDVYSFGLVLLELATNLKLYDEARSHRFLSSHVNALKIVGRHLEAKDPTGGDEPGANDLVDLFIKIGLKCCADQKKYRPEMAEVVEALKEATSAFKSLQPITTEPLATMQQHFTGVAGWLSPGNAALAAPQNSPRLSPSDNLQVGPSSPLPPAGTTPPMGTSNTQNFQQQQQLTRHHLMQQQLQKLQNTPYQPLLPQQQQKPLFHQGHLQKTQVPQQYIVCLQQAQQQQQQQQQQLQIQQQQLQAQQLHQPQLLQPYQGPVGFIHNNQPVLAGPVVVQPSQQRMTIFHPVANTPLAAQCVPAVNAGQSPNPIVPSPCQTDSTQHQPPETGGPHNEAVGRAAPPDGSTPQDSNTPAVPARGSGRGADFGGQLVEYISPASETMNAAVAIGQSARPRNAAAGEDCFEQTDDGQPTHPPTGNSCETEDNNLPLVTLLGFATSKSSTSTNTNHSTSTSNSSSADISPN